jgi:stage V sporulation protein G
LFAGQSKENAMEITEVRIKLMEDSGDRLQAFCSITFDDCFVVRDLKIIDGSNGPFVAMPSRKLTSHCPRCGCKNHLRAGYCNQCGTQLSERNRDQEGRAKLYADIAHPINSKCREMIQERVIAEFRSEVERASQPGYISRYDDDYGDAGPEDLHLPTRNFGSRKQIQGAEPQPRPPHMGNSSQPAAKNSSNTNASGNR